MLRSRLFLVLVCSTLSISFFPPSARAQQDPPAKGREVTALYRERCAGCHGPEGAGGSGGSLIDGHWRYGGDDASLSRSIHDRHPAASMPAIGDTLTAAEIRALVILIHEKGAAFERDHTRYNKPAPGDTLTTKAASFRLESVIDSGLEEPWALAFLPDGNLLVTERPGRLRLIDHGRLLPDPIRNTPPVYGGEGGLLHVAIDPHFSESGNHWIYLSYGDRAADGQGMTAVIRAHLENGELTGAEQLFKSDPSLYRLGGQRFGSRLLFDHTGHLFFSVGDRAHPGDEQDLTHPNGKVHRVNLDGHVPDTNPFVHQAGAIGSIWTYGHRNPQGLAWNPVNGDLWESEHGPRGGDELNILVPGHNYGWPVITYGMNYGGTPITDHLTQAGMDQPVTYWVPSIAVSSIAFYTGSQIPQLEEQLICRLAGGSRTSPSYGERPVRHAPGNSLERHRPRTGCGGRSGW